MFEAARQWIDEDPGLAPGWKAGNLSKSGEIECLAELTYHDLSLVWLVRQVDSDLEDICKDW